MLEKQHLFFDLVQRLLNPTLVLKSNSDSNEEGPMLVTFEFIPAKLHGECKNVAGGTKVAFNCNSIE